jgi:hypothetical protein
MRCKHCGYDKRVIKYGKKPGKILLQRWMCLKCNRYSFTPLLLDGQKQQKEEEEKVNQQQKEEPEDKATLSFQQYQQDQFFKRKNSKQLIDQATGAAMNAIHRKRKKR